MKLRLTIEIDVNPLQTTDYTNIGRAGNSIMNNFIQAHQPDWVQHMAEHCSHMQLELIEGTE